MDYGEVLERAWRITWRFKGLWVLGILAGCSGGNAGGGGGGGGGGPDFSGSSDFESAPQAFSQLETFIENIEPAILVAVVLALLALGILLTIVFLLLGVFGQAGLIYGADQADRGEAVTLAKAASGGLDSFWRLFALELILLAIGVLLAVTVVVVVFIFVLFTLGIGALLLIPLICIMTPVLLVLGFALGIYLQFVRTAIVVDSFSITQALYETWTLVRAHVAPAAVMGLILVIGGWIASLILSVPFFLLLIPLIGGVAFGTETALGIGIGLAALCCLAYLPVMLLLNGVLQTYIQSAWTLTYRRLTDRSGQDLASAST
ncbi:MAG: hypothetical protein R3191_05335 [Anaerolineales bacterium]|nr:hypothetical protein [Anaerolineales bacterium]